VTPNVGDLAPPFTLPTQRGLLVSLAEALRQGAVTLAFVGRVTTAGGDTPADRRILAMINDYQRLHEGGGMTLLPVVSNSRAQARRYVEELGTPFNLLCDEDGAVARLYNLNRWTWLRRRDIRPALFGIEMDGRVGFRQIGEWAGKTEPPGAP
jgi:thioredoxin-dependent peroxiredoxin